VKRAEWDKVRFITYYNFIAPYQNPKEPSFKKNIDNILGDVKKKVSAEDRAERDKVLAEIREQRERLGRD